MSTDADGTGTDATDADATDADGTDAGAARAARAVAADLDEPTLRAEAERAWHRAAAVGVVPDAPSLALLAAVASTGALTVVAVAWRLSAWFAGRPWALAAVVMATAVLVVALIGGPLWAWRRAHARARRRVVEARARRRSGRCPRCRAPLLARALDEAGPRRCGACGAALLEARGLIVQRVSHPVWRARRWRAAAARRLRDQAIGLAPSLSPTLWLGAVVGSLGALFCTGALVGGAVGVPPRAMEAPLGRVREVPHHGTAHAQPIDDAALPPGPTTRPRAPLWVGTQVLARKGPGPHHQLAVVVRLDPPRAFVVYADGDSDWVRRGDLLAPELAPGDALELFDGSGYAEVELLERVGPALRVRRDGRAEWTSASRIRVRSDAAHARGDGLESEIPPGAWVEVPVTDAELAPGRAALRPGLAVESGVEGLRVALSDGSARWVAVPEVRPQRVAPGARVWVDGWTAEAIVAARIGHALVVVDDDGVRRWTALSRVRRWIADPAE